jgi:DNA-directed RNA polymerase specialized sigma24 family protein
MRQAIKAKFHPSRNADPSLQGESADDFVQTTYVKALARPDRLPIQAEKVARYLATSARNETIDHLRRQAFELPTAELPSETQAVDQTSNGFYRTRRPTRRRTSSHD